MLVPYELVQNIIYSSTSKKKRTLNTTKLCRNKILVIKEKIRYMRPLDDKTSALLINTKLETLKESLG